ncbi:MAG: (d)CMP kinase [Clostridiales bacterium]|uniref:(d)CMP kinase n=1 Tax=Aminipila sp. TaxID=2060095 RepID=UPI001DAE5D01|nr:(d)CMP kinase [Aminipila sp.]MBE6035403.1 (d)CMP kinase [Clostridiales bacterium]
MINKINTDKLTIAIDGPSGAGKSTIAKEVARLLSVDYIDTGAMYRAIGYKLGQKNIDLEDQKALNQVLDDTVIDFEKGNMILDGLVVNDIIRTPEASRMASICSALPEVRKKLVVLQRKMGQTKSVVMDGRDIGTNVLPDAEFKFFMTASAEERAQRRFQELIEKGEQVEFSQVLKDIIQRDHNDTTRELNPLRKAKDAVELDTTGMSISEVTDKIINLVRCGR